MIVIPERGVVSNMTRQSIITAALCRSKSDVVFKDDGKKISLQKPNIELSSSSSVRLIDHHQQLFKIPVDALSKLLHDAVLEQETQLPAATSSDDIPHSSTSTLHSLLTASAVPQTKNQYLSTKTKKVRSRMRRQAEKRLEECCSSSSSSEDFINSSSYYY